MSVDEQVERAVERVRATWGVCTAAFLVWVIIVLPWWAFIPAIIFSAGTYYGSLWFTGIMLGMTIDHGQLEEERAKEAVAVGETKEGFTKESVEAVGLTLGDVVTTGEIFGRFMDQPMFEWVDIVADKKGALHRYVFENVTPRDKAGNLLLPRKEGFACYNGVTYKLTQPA
jgi:hypothetical protein